MAIVLASFVNGKFLMGLNAARPCVDSPDETVEGFPEFAVNIEDVKDPEVQRKLRALAKRIVASHRTPFRIIGFDVHGHADVTLRIPAGPEREQTELEVSRDRAEAAQQLLFKLIEEEGGKAILNGIKANSTTIAVGSKCRKVIPAKTEAEMKRNRRVEIFLKEFRFTPAPPTPPQPPKPPVPPQPWTIQIKSGFVDSSNVPGTDVLSVAVIRLHVVIVDVERKQQAKFFAESKGLTIGLFASPTIDGASSTTIREGDPVPFTTTDAARGISLQSFQGDLNMGQNPGAGVSVLSKGGKFAMIFSALRVGTHPKTVELGGGDDPFAAPQASVGIAPGEGSLTMEGQPFPVK